MMKMNQALLSTLCVFFPQFPLIIPQNQRANVLSHFAKILDGEQFILPIPEGAPQELVRMHIRDAAQNYVLGFSESRISIDFTPTSDDPYDTLLEKNAAFIKKILTHFSAYRSDLVFNKIGYVVRTMIDADAKEYPINDYLTNEYKSAIGVTNNINDQLLLRHQLQVKKKIAGADHELNKVILIANDFKSAATNQRVGRCEVDLNNGNLSDLWTLDDASLTAFLEIACVENRQVVDALSKETLQV